MLCRDHGNFIQNKEIISIKTTGKTGGLGFDVKPLYGRYPNGSVFLLLYTKTSLGICKTLTNFLRILSVLSKTIDNNNIFVYNKIENKRKGVIPMYSTL